MDEIFCLEDRFFDEILDRQKKNKQEVPQVSFGEIVREVLMFANRFIAPSRNGTIYIDNPLTRVYYEDGKIDYDRTKLVFVACFGDKSEMLVGRSISASKGLVGYVYRTGKAILVNDVLSSELFDPEYSKELDVSPDSILAVPILIEKRPIGVIQLINKKGNRPYSNHDLELMEYFCERYVSNTIIRAIEFRKDLLTGLYAQKYFEARLENVMDNLDEAGGKGYLYFIDLDCFKEVNDSFGHRIGSRAISAVAEFLHSYIFNRCGRRGLLARYGGDEYNLFVSGLEEKEALNVARDILKGIADLKMIISGKYGENVDVLAKVTASIGVASLVNDFKTVDDLVRLADEAMYRAKKSRNSIVFVKKGRYATVK
ncbi:MAG: sensor domain-containing diguanylate cyclase [Pseudomonadota bacterium]